MKKLRDFVCKNPSCADATVVVERLADDKVAPLCKACTKPMLLVPSFPIVPTHVSWAKWRI